MVRIGDRAPNLGEGGEQVGHEAPHPVEGGPGGHPDGERLRVPGLGVQLHLQQGEPTVHRVHLPGEVGRGPPVRLGGWGAPGGEDAGEQLLEVVDGLEGGLVGVQPPRLVVGEELFWGGHLGALLQLLSGLGLGPLLLLWERCRRLPRLLHPPPPPPPSTITLTERGAAMRAQRSLASIRETER